MINKIEIGTNKDLDKVKHTSNALGYLKFIAHNYKGEKKYQSDVSVTGEKYNENT